MTRQLPSNAHTLYRHPAATVKLPAWDATRDLVQYRGPVPVLEDRWQAAWARAVSGSWVPVLVRRTDCGGGCRCAGEYR